MPRKKITESNYCKFSVDVSFDNKEVLDDLTSNYSMKYGPMLNKILKTFCRMNPKIKKVIEKACLSEYTRLIKLIEKTEDDFHRYSLEQERDEYIEILKFINRGTYAFTDTKKKTTMKKIELYDGYLIIPEDWIIVNEERAKECRYAAVLECRNSAKFGVPHFVYFNQFEYACDYTQAMENEFLRLCQKAWPKFKEIKELSDKNQLVPDPDNEGEYLNAESHFAAPIIGLFHIADQGYHPIQAPFGAMIVRTKTEDNGNE